MATRPKMKVKFIYAGEWVEVLVMDRRQGQGIMVHRSQLAQVMLNFRILEFEPRKRILEN